MTFYCFVVWLFVCFLFSVSFSLLLLLLLCTRSCFVSDLIEHFVFVVVVVFYQVVEKKEEVEKRTKRIKIKKIKKIKEVTVMGRIVGVVVVVRW